MLPNFIYKPLSNHQKANVGDVEAAEERFIKIKMFVSIQSFDLYEGLHLLFCCSVLYRSCIFHFTVINKSFQTNMF